MTDDLRLYVEHGARLLGLQVPPGQVPLVAAQLELLHRHLAVVLAVDLPPDVEPAPVFVP